MWPHLHGNDEPVDDQRRPEARSEPEEEHPPAVVAAERLHGRVVDELRRLAERGLEVESDPALAEVDRLADDAPVHDRRRHADRDADVLPVRRHLEHAVDHLLRGERRYRSEPPPLVDAVEHRLDVRAADVDGEDRRRSWLDRILALLLLAHGVDPAAAASATTSAFAVDDRGRRGSTGRRRAGAERVHLVVARHEPEDLPRPVEHGVGQRHPPPALVLAGERDVAIGDVEHRIARDERRGVAVRAQAQVDRDRSARGSARRVARRRRVEVVGPTGIALHVGAPRRAAGSLRAA